MCAIYFWWNSAQVAQVPIDILPGGQIEQSLFPTPSKLSKLIWPVTRPEAGVDNKLPLPTSISGAKTNSPTVNTPRTKCILHFIGKEFTLSIHCGGAGVCKGGPHNQTDHYQLLHRSKVAIAGPAGKVRNNKLGLQAQLHFWHTRTSSDACFPRHLQFAHQVVHRFSQGLSCMAFWEPLTCNCLALQILGLGSTPRARHTAAACLPHTDLSGRMTPVSSSFFKNWVKNKLVQPKKITRLFFDL